jgi:hypothetical protein
MVLSTFLQSMAANESHRPRQDAGKGPWLWHLLFIGFPQGLPTRSKAFPQVAEKLWGVSQDRIEWTTDLHSGVLVAQKITY